MRPAGLFLALLALAACSKSDVTGTGGSPTGTSLSGALAATDGRTGSLTLTSPTPPPVARPSAPGSLAALTLGVINLTGNVSLSDGTTATLSGTWDTGTGALNVSGGGFTFGGTFSGGSLSGSFTGPSITGVFSLQLAATDATQVVYCGTYTGRQPEEMPVTASAGLGPDNGTWNLVVDAATVTAVILTSNGTPSVVQGTRSGSSLTLTVPGGTATGTIGGASGEYVNGAYNVPGNSSGTFQGSKAMCSATSESATIASITINQPGIIAVTSGLQYQRLAFDSTLVFATAKDAAGNIVAAPQLTWSYTGPVRSNTATTPKGQKWIVGTVAGSASVKVTSTNVPAVSATANIFIK